MKFSIIVPAYNVAPYLRGCMESMLSQTFSDWEMVCIDDGSTDETGAILDEYSARDARIKVFHKVNGGVSVARNLGLEKASGEWVGFLDGDDTFSPDLLEIVHGKLEGLCFVSAVGFGMVLVRADGGIIKRHGGRKNPPEAVLDGDSVLKDVVGGYSRFAWSSCDKFYRRDLIARFCMRFREGMAHQEDTLFAHQYLAQCGKVLLLPHVDGYRYLMREGSAIHSEPQFPPMHTLVATREIYELWRKTRKPGILRRAQHFLAAFPSVGKAHGAAYRERCVDWLIDEAVIDAPLLRAMFCCGTVKTRVFAFVYALVPKYVRRQILMSL